MHPYRQAASCRGGMDGKDTINRPSDLFLFHYTPLLHPSNDDRDINPDINNSMHFLFDCPKHFEVSLADKKSQPTDGPTELIRQILFQILCRGRWKNLRFWSSNRCGKSHESFNFILLWGQICHSFRGANLILEKNSWRTQPFTFLVNWANVMILPIYPSS